MSFADLIESVLLERHEAGYAKEKRFAMVERAVDPGIFGLLIEVGYQLDDLNKAGMAARIGVEAHELDRALSVLKKIDRL